MDIKKSKDTADSWLKDNENAIIELSDRIWEFAELGLLEYKTSETLSGELEKHGFMIERGIAGMPTAFMATWGEGKPVVGIMGEMDALAGLSQKIKPVPEPVEPGAAGHGCGHNIHGTSGAAAALAVKEAMERGGMAGTLKFFGCPAEETLVGKVFMVRDGYFDGMDAVLSHHASQFNTAGLGSFTAMNSVKFHFYGRTAHAAGSPEQGISALDAAELMNIGVNYLREHVIEKARLHYIIEDGGGQPNVVPGYARSWYYVRAPEREEVEYIYNRVMQIADGADKMAMTNHKVEFLTGCYNLIPNKTLSDLVVCNMREIGAPAHSDEEKDFAGKLISSIPEQLRRETIKNFKPPGWESLMDKLFDERVLDAWDEGKVRAGSTDVSDVSWMAPAMEFSTAACVLGTPGHSWQFTAQSGMSIGHKSLIFASRVMAATVIDLITDPDRREKAQQEWKSRMAGKQYLSPLPRDLKPPLDQLKRS